MSRATFSPLAYTSEAGKGREMSTRSIRLKGRDVFNLARNIINYDDCASSRYYDRCEE